MLGHSLEIRNQTGEAIFPATQRRSTSGDETAHSVTDAADVETHDAL